MGKGGADRAKKGKKDAQKKVGKVNFGQLYANTLDVFKKTSLFAMLQGGLGY